MYTTNLIPTIPARIWPGTRSGTAREVHVMPTGRIVVEGTEVQAGGSLSLSTDQPLYALALDGNCTVTVTVEPEPEYRDGKLYRSAKEVGHY
ncbi:hypothetical protein AB0K04_21675 [Micromonospora coxensis]|uniref:hypothetical protein n=1 Tax=Micromonospora coxensis TaxID=356852 RepID=UPI00343701BB